MENQVQVLVQIHQVQVHILMVILVLIQLMENVAIAAQLTIADGAGLLMIPLNGIQKTLLADADQEICLKLCSSNEEIKIKEYQIDKES